MLPRSFCFWEEIKIYWFRDCYSRRRRCVRLRVTVDYLGHVKRLIGVDQGEEVQLMENAEVRDLLLYLAEKHGEAFKKAIYDVSGGDLKANFIMTVNGLLLNQLEGVKTRLRDGDHVVVMPIVSGG